MQSWGLAPPLAKRQQGGRRTSAQNRGSVRRKKDGREAASGPKSMTTHLPTMARQTTGARWPHIGQTWFKGNGLIFHNVTQKQLNSVACFKSWSLSSETSSFYWNMRPTSRHWLKFLQGNNQPKPAQAVPGKEASCVQFAVVQPLSRPFRSLGQMAFIWFATPISVWIDTWQKK